jgi:hypothetical protein
MDEDKLIKIKLAAEYAQVSEGTIYNWIRQGFLKLGFPGYVLESDLRRAIIFVSDHKKEQAKSRSEKFKRDENGKFRLLSGDLNGKTEGGLL